MSLNSKVTFATSVYENDWQELLLNGRLQKMISACNYELEHRLLIINHKEPSAELLTTLQALLKNGVITQFYFSHMWRNLLLSKYGIEEKELFPGYNYLIQNLCAVHFCPTDYLLWFTCDSIIENDEAWIGQAISIFENDSNVVVANPTLNSEFSIVKKIADKELGNFYQSKGFSDQCCLLPVEMYRGKIYSHDHTKSSRFPGYAGFSFERRIDSWMHTHNFHRITHKSASYQHKNFSTVAPETLFTQKKSDVASWIDFGISFQKVQKRVNENFSNLLESKSFYHYCARLYSQKNQKENTLNSLNALIKKWPKHSVLSQRIVNAINNETVTLDGITFSLRSDILSLHMQLAVSRGDYEVGELNMLCEYAQQGDRVLELGSGIGFIGLNYLKRNPDNYFIGCEANPYLINLIAENQQQNNIHFPIENVILDNYQGSTDFYITDDFWASSLVKPEKYKACKSLPVKNINEFISLHRINTIIMDIEGAEYDLIPKIDLSKIDKIVIELHPNVYGQQGMETIFSKLKDQSFELPPGKRKSGIMFLYNTSTSSLEF